MEKNLLQRCLLTTLFLLAVSNINLFAQNNQENQTTEGTDFYVTFLRADSHDKDDKKITLSLSISTREACEVTLENTRSGYQEVLQLSAGELKEVTLYNGTAYVDENDPRQNDKKICYTYIPDKVDSSAIHVKSTAPISLFASNHKDKSFDATNVLPTVSLQSEYIIQTYPPSVHADTPQGSHFAIIATEDNTVVDYSPTVEIQGEFGQFQNALNAWGEERVFEQYPEYERFREYLTTGMISTPILQKGQVWYVWTGDKQGETADLSGTMVKARDGKKIAVFQGCPHTNIPDKIRDRDHIFSQAMPTNTWGNTFAITSSMTRKRDIIRVLALNDGTEVRVNGQLVYTFDFSTNPKRTFEFEIGEQNVSCTDKNQTGTLPLASRANIPVFYGTDCMVETSCPCAVHLFMVSNTYDDTPDGDPAMVWINPIEQVIDQITFATYMASNTHYVNIVTTKQNVSSMRLDSNDISGDFSPVTGSNDKYYFARKNITHATHTLKSDGGFIAHVYGYGDKESYAYSAGGSAKILTQAITINGEIFTPESNNILCGEDNINFSCDLNYEWESITWNFGDGSPQVTGQDNVSHFYEKNGVYHAYVLIERRSTNLCEGQSAVDSIPITVNIGRFEFEIGVPEGEMCRKDGEPRQFRIPFNNKSNTPLEGDNVEIGFNQEALDDGFTNNDLQVLPDMFIVNIPETAEAGNNYGIHIHIESTNNCGETDTTLYFRVNYEADDIITQRFDNVLGLLSVAFQDDELSDFHWYKNEELMENEQNAVLYLETPDTISEYYVCFTINKGTAQEVTTCSCPKKFSSNKDGYQFETDAQMITLQYITNQDIFVNTKEEATATWFRIDGNKLTESTITAGGGLITTPNDKGLYVLRIVAGKQQRSFKILVSDVQPL